MSGLGVTNIQNASGGNTLTQAQIKNYTTKRPFNYQIAWNNRRTAISASSNGTLWDIPITKISPTSTLHIYGWLHGRVPVNGQVGWYAEIGSNRSYRGMAYAEIGGAAGGYSGGDNDCRRVIQTFFPNVTATGALNVRIGWAALDGGSNSPFDVWNPDNRDEGRTPNEQGSLLYIWEVEPT
jgi:hypothetical protein